MWRNKILEIFLAVLVWFPVLIRFYVTHKLNSLSRECRNKIGEKAKLLTQVEFTIFAWTLPPWLWDTIFSGLFPTLCTLSRWSRLHAPFRRGRRGIHHCWPSGAECSSSSNLLEKEITLIQWYDGGKPVDQKYRLPSASKLRVVEEGHYQMTLSALFHKVPQIAQRGL